MPSKDLLDVGGVKAGMVPNGRPNLGLIDPQSIPSLPAAIDPASREHSHCLPPRGSIQRPSVWDVLGPQRMSDPTNIDPSTHYDQVGPSGDTTGRSAIMMRASMSKVTDDARAASERIT